MKNIKWLIALASKRPLVFSLALLMIAVTTLAVVVADRDKKLDKAHEEKRLLEEYYRVKFDSLSSYYRSRETQLNNEVKSTLNYIIEDYKTQLQEQKELNDRILKTINRNRQIIIKNKQQ